MLYASIIILMEFWKDKNLDFDADMAVRRIKSYKKDIFHYFGCHFRSFIC